MKKENKRDMIFWQATFPTIVLESKNPLVMIYIDRGSMMVEAQVRLALYQEMFPDDMFQRPEIKLRRMGRHEIASIPLEDLESLLCQTKQSFVPFEILISEMDIEC